MTEHDADEIDGDIIPEAMAIRRGMVYRKNSRGHICEASVPHPLLIDELYERKILGDDHHFYGAQLITMRKLFLNPVSLKLQILRVKQDEKATPDKPVFIEDADYLKVLRAIRVNRERETVREICDETAEPWKYRLYALHQHQVGFAFDALVEAVIGLWEEKRDRAESK